MIDLDIMPPDWKFAENHAKAVKPGIADGLHMKTGNSVFCQCCLKPVEKEDVPLCANSKELEFLGFGFPLYFIYLKYSIVLILILICSYCGVSLYWAIEYNREICLHHRLLSGSGSGDPHCTSFLILFSRIEDHIQTEQIILRIASFIIHLCALIYIRDNIRKTVEYYDEKTTSLSDYSFIIKNLPQKDGIQQNIKDFVNNNFKQKWQEFEDTYHLDHFKASEQKVMQITLIPDLHAFFKLEKEKHLLIQEKRKILIEEQKQGPSSRVAEASSMTDLQLPEQTIDSKIAEVKNKIENVKTECRQKSLKDKLHAQMAIITLNTQLHKNTVVEFGQQNKLTKQLVGKYFGDFEETIEIQEAPQPNEIIWHNLHYSAKDRLIGKIMGWTLTIVFIAVCTVGFYFILVAKTDSLLHALESYSTEDLVHKSPEYKVSVFLVFFLIFLIILFNKIVMSWVLHQFTHLQKHEHSSDEEFSFALKYTLGLFFTTALMTLAVEDITYHNFFAHQYGVIEEESIMFFVNALFVPLFMLINPYQIKNRLVRYFKKGKKYFTQAEANRIMSDNPYTMGKQYAQIVETLWFTFLYATMIPLGAFITLVGITFYYWVDKFNLLRRSSLSHNISGEMAMVSLKLLDFTLVMKPVGQLIFDSGIRNHIEVESIVLTCIGFVYVLLPMDKILQFFHEEEFQQQEKTFNEVKHLFLESYQTLNPIMSNEIEVNKTFKNLQMSVNKKISLTNIDNIASAIMNNVMTTNNELGSSKQNLNDASDNFFLSNKKLLPAIQSPERKNHTSSNNSLKRDSEEKIQIPKE